MLTLRERDEARIEADERARRAVLEARKSLPRWLSFARVLSRNPGLKMVLSGSVSATDGDTIWIKVPMELGDLTGHEKSKCGIRLRNKTQACPACRVQENVDTIIIHEVAHLVFETFEKMDEDTKSKVVLNAVKLECNGNSKHALRLTKQLEKAMASFDDTYKIAASISPFMSFLMNVGEDIRVNTQMQKARPGTVDMFSALYADIAENGMLQPDGSVTKYHTLGVNIQMALALFCRVSGYDYAPHFVDQVVEDLEDAQLNDVLDELRVAETVAGVYKQAFPLLENLRRLGYFRNPEEPEDTDEDEEQGEGDEDSESEDGSADEGSDDAQANDGDSDSEPSGDESGDSEDGDEPGDGAGDQAGNDASEEGEDGDFTDDPSQDSGRGDDGSPSNQQADDGDPGDQPGKPSDGQQADPSQSGADGSPSSGPPSTGLAEDSDTEPSFGREEPPAPYTQEDLEKDGTAEEVEKIMKIFSGHGEDEDELSVEETEILREAIEMALKQIDYFDSPSWRVTGVNIGHYAEREMAWQDCHRYNFETIVVPETILAPALNRLRLVFTNNRARRSERNLKSGKINARALGKRAPVGDPRLFKKTTIPSRKDYFVVVGIDVSGSTSSRNGATIRIIKEAAMAKAELLDRLHIPFALYAHSSGYDGAVDIMEVKGPKEPWGKAQREALSNLRPYAGNLDGHTLEFYRKVAQRQDADDKIILYYTDGEMPAGNYDEELEILQSNIVICRRLGIHLVGVGIGTDSPRAHGLDTIVLNSVDDVPKVVSELQKRLGG